MSMKRLFSNFRVVIDDALKQKKLVDFDKQLVIDDVVVEAKKYTSVHIRIPKIRRRIRLQNL